MSFAATSSDDLLPDMKAVEEDHPNMLLALEEFPNTLVFDGRVMDCSSSAIISRSFRPLEWTAR